MIHGLGIPVQDGSEGMLSPWIMGQVGQVARPRPREREAGRPRQSLASRTWASRAFPVAIGICTGTGSGVITSRTSTLSSPAS